MWVWATAHKEMPKAVRSRQWADVNSQRRCLPSSSPSSSRTTHPSLRRKRQSSSALSLVLFPPNPLRWASVGALLGEGKSPLRTLRIFKCGFRCKRQKGRNCKAFGASLAAAPQMRQRNFQSQPTAFQMRVPWVNDRRCAPRRAAVCRTFAPLPTISRTKKRGGKPRPRRRLPRLPHMISCVPRLRCAAPRLCADRPHACSFRRSATTWCSVPGLFRSAPAPPTASAEIFPSC